jgi:hypothetical protein
LTANGKVFAFFASVPAGPYVFYLAVGYGQYRPATLDVRRTFHCPLASFQPVLT